MDSFVFMKPKSRKRNAQRKLLAEDPKYAEIDEYLEAEAVASSEASFNKFDGAESIVGFYGADEKKKKKNYKEGSEVTNYDKDIFSDEEEYDDNELEDSDNESMCRLKIERLLEDQSDLQEIEVKYIDNEIIIKKNGTYKLYEKVVNSIVEQVPGARETFFKAKVNAEWENDKMAKLKKKLNKQMKLYEEFLNIGERKLTLSIENGLRKRIPGISGNFTHVYTELRPPVIRETQTLEEIIDDPHLFEKGSNLCNDNMEITLADFEEGDSNVIRNDFDISEMELDNTGFDDGAESEVEAEYEQPLTTNSSTEDSLELKTAVNSPTENIPESKTTEETLPEDWSELKTTVSLPKDSSKLKTTDSNHIQTEITVNTLAPEKPSEEPNIDLSAATPDVHMELTALDLPKRQTEDDEESTASDLEFFVNEEVKRLQKIHKIPNDFLRFLFSNNEPEQLVHTEKDVEAENVNDKEDATSAILEEDDDHEVEYETDEEAENIEEEEDQKLKSDLDDEEETNEKEQDLEVKHHVEEEEVPENEEEIEEQDENMSNTSSHDQRDSSSTTGSVLSEIQNTLEAGVDLPPPPNHQAPRVPVEAQRKRMILPCVGIPREKLPYVRIVMVPTIDIIKAYTKFDEEVYRMTHAPDGSSLTNSEEILAGLMRQAQEVGTADFL